MEHRGSKGYEVRGSRESDRAAYMISEESKSNRSKRSGL